MPTLSVSRDHAPNGEGLDEHGLGIHGGAAETSLVMHLRPDLVDLTLAERWVPEHLADFELIGFNARPVSFGWPPTTSAPGRVRRSHASFADPTAPVLLDASVAQAVAHCRRSRAFSPRGSA